MAKKLLQNISVPHSMSLIYNIKEIQKTESRYKYYLIPATVQNQQYGRVLDVPAEH